MGMRDGIPDGVVPKGYRPDDQFEADRAEVEQVVDDLGFHVGELNALAEYCRREAWVFGQLVKTQEGDNRRKYGEFAADFRAAGSKPN